MAPTSLVERLYQLRIVWLAKRLARQLLRLFKIYRKNEMFILPLYFYFSIFLLFLFLFLSHSISSLSHSDSSIPVSPTTRSCLSSRIDLPINRLGPRPRRRLELPAPPDGCRPQLPRASAPARRLMPASGRHRARAPLRSRAPADSSLPRAPTAALGSAAASLSVAASNSNG